MTVYEEALRQILSDTARDVAIHGVGIVLMNADLTMSRIPPSQYLAFADSLIWAVKNSAYEASEKSH